MRFFNVLFYLLFLASPLFSQTLFESSNATEVSTKNVRSVNTTPISKTTSPTPLPSPKAGQRFISTNLESLILRGDIQFTYEISQQDGWSTIFSAHVNPQGNYSDETGDMHLLAGGRMYFQEQLINSNIYLQGLVGFAHFSNWDLLVAIELGHRLQWKPSVFLDLGLVIQRSYADENKDPMAFIKANITFSLDKPLLPFL